MGLNTQLGPSLTLGLPDRDTHSRTDGGRLCKAIVQWF